VGDGGLVAGATGAEPIEDVEEERQLVHGEVASPIMPHEGVFPGAASAPRSVTATRV
jgi:hypothetical protein